MKTLIIKHEYYQHLLELSSRKTKGIFPDSPRMNRPNRFELHNLVRIDLHERT